MINQELAHQLFAYDAETGKLYRKTGKFNGSDASLIDARGYVYVFAAGKRHLAHRIIWLMHYGAFPEAVDHIDMNRSNNRIENLREATNSQNQANTLPRIAGRLKGASQFNGKWRAKIKVRGKYVFLGYFATEQEAHDAYKLAAAEHFGDFARVA